MSSVLLQRLLPRSTLGRWLLGILLFCIAVFLMFVHVRTVRLVQARGLPAALRVTELKQRVATLQDQVALMDIQAAVRTGSVNEQIRSTALPAELSTESITRFIQLFAHELGSNDVSTVHISDPISVNVVTDEAAPAHETLWAADTTFRMTVHPQRLQDTLLLLELSGIVTVGDALSLSEKEAFLLLAEREGPGAVLALEQFLLHDLLLYSRTTSAVQDALLRTISSESFETAFFALLEDTTLPAYQRLLAGDFGFYLAQQKLWPIRLFTIESIGVTHTSAHGQSVDVTVRLFFRRSELLQ